MYLSTRTPPLASQSPLPDKHITISVLLAGVAGGIVLAVVVMVCCKVCLKKKRPLTRQHVVFSRSSERQHSKARKYHSIDSSASVEIETSCVFSDGMPSPKMACTILRIMNWCIQWCQSRDGITDNIFRESREFRTEEAAQGETAHVSARSIAKTLPDVTESLSPEDKRKKAALLDRGPVRDNGASPVPKSRRTSLGGIHRQASVCLSDEEEETSFIATPSVQAEEKRAPTSSSKSEVVAPAPEDREAPVVSETRQVAAEVHWNGGNSHTVVVHDVDRTSTGSINSHNQGSRKMSLSSYSHSSPDTNSVRTVLICPEYLSRRRSEPDPNTSRFIVVASSLSDAHDRKKAELFKLRKSGQRILDLEEYHYANTKKQQHQTSLLVPKSASPFKEKAMSMHDLPAQGEGWLEVPQPLRETESVEGGCLERGLEIHQKRYSKSFLQRTSVSPVYDDDEEPPSKVRYNDMGSREEVNEEVLEFSPIESDELEEMLKKGEEEQLRQQYRELWQLRATLEEEEEHGSLALDGDANEAATCDEGCSTATTVAMDQLAEPDVELATSYTTSFESSTEQGPQEDSSDPPVDIDGRSSNHHLQLPSYESRRHNYKSLLNRRLQGRGLEYRPVGSAETSLDSLETEWSSTERTEGITTSIESTTDNTDSAGEGQNNNHKLQQMKADSGYKSMEGSSTKTPAKVAKVQIQHTTGDDDGIELSRSVDESEKDKKSEGSGSMQSISKELSHVQEKIATLKELCKRSRQKVTEAIVPQSRSSGSVGVEEEERKVYKSALKKRRQYGKDRQSAALSQDSVHQSQGDSATEASSVAEEYPLEMRGKSSVFHRFFRSGRPRIERTMVRDYSIDEKSDALFRQFLRQDPAYETEDYRSRSPRFHGPLRLHHYRGIDSDSGSPRLHCKVISPRLSIEEEEEQQQQPQHKSAEESSKKSESVPTAEPSTSTDIPIIRLPVGE